MGWGGGRTHQLLSIAACDINEWFPVQQGEDPSSGHLGLGGVRSKGAGTTQGEGGEHNCSKHSAENSNQ